MYTKEEALAKITELVEKFSDQLPAYKKSDYNETLTRKDFIDPFFEALGWDINNRSGAWEAYREVIHEDKLKIGGVTTAPDYSFRLTGGQRLFFVEAKKPSIVIKDDVAPAYQVRLYGWNAKLALSVVTDFEEFAIYDCSKKPLKTDKASKARLNYFTYKDYIKEFDFFWNTFSKQQVIKGGLVKFQQSDKKGTATVDKAFLENLDEWRKVLAANINKNTPDTGEDELNYAVQQIIDRIIFLRIAEDRALEPYGQLKTCLQNENHYRELYRQFRVADDKYNSGLFHFKKEKENTETPDNISGSLSIDNKVIKSIINSIYPPVSDFRFNYLPVEILGSAYEQFLGKQIVIKGSQATIEDKPEVRKAGGVYYTPQYIVEYIVEQTVGKLCVDKTPKEVSRIKIVDPACGSGSFLLGAYQYLLKWHMDYYTNNSKALKQKEAVLTPEGNLTTAEKKRILLNNLYGVDIDRNAVEVTKLSLLLKCMEGETTASISTQMTFFNERVLPSLEKNIKCGNSLIDLDYYDTQLDFGEEKKIKPFNWRQQFQEVFKQGGFDAVIGNPPYGANFNEHEKKYLLNTFKNQNYQLDSYLLFLEQSSKKLLRTKGYFGMIIPNPWLTNLLQKNLRNWLFSTVCISEIVHFKYQVFSKVTVDTEIVLFNNESPLTNLIKVTIIEKGESLTSKTNNIILHEQKDWIILNGNTVNIYNSAKDRMLMQKIQIDVKPLESYCKINVGIKPYQVGKGKPQQKRQDVNDRVFDCDFKKDDNYRLYLRGVDINRFITSPIKPRFIKYGEWLAEPRPAANFDAAVKLFMRQTGDSLIATADYNKFLCLNNLHVIVPKEDIQIQTEFLLGILNSKLLNWYYQSINPEKGEALAEVKKSIVATLPIKRTEDKKEKKLLHDKITELAQQILHLNLKKQSIKEPTEIVQLNQRIAYTDERINKLVYELYGLSEEEIGIVEGKVKE